MNTKNWLIGVVGVALYLTANATGAQGRRMEGDLDVIPVRDDIYLMVMEPAGNVAVLIGEDGALMVDDQFAPMTERLLSAIDELSDRPLRYVLNTHWHGDHTGSNVNLGRMGYTLVAHDNVRSRMSSVQYHMLFRTGTRPHPPEALPVITYGDRMSFHLNGERIDVIHLPVAHTDGDSAVYFREADVLHTGDAFINRGYPLIDVASGGTIKGQIEATNRMLELIGDNTIIIPGHGPLADKRRMTEIRDMLVTARQKVVGLIDQGLDVRAIKAADPLAELNPVWEEGFIKSRAFVNIIYQSETGDWSVPTEDEIKRWDE
ncbi:MAG: MBL fold metallo-hydrolase [Chromatiales bacterium]|nr:MAG: MBL fold metallo-hydrolase [Chromatiales bacterium]